MVSLVGRVHVAKYLINWEVTRSNPFGALGVRPCLFGRWIDPFGLICLIFPVDVAATKPSIRKPLLKKSIF